MFITSENYHNIVETDFTEQYQGFRDKSTLRDFINVEQLTVEASYMKDLDFVSSWTKPILVILRNNINLVDISGIQHVCVHLVIINCPNVDIDFTDFHMLKKFDIDRPYDNSDIVLFR
jgi:hypothetical protein